jgi:hypothetical protein
MFKGVSICGSQFVGRLGMRSRLCKIAGRGESLRCDAMHAANWASVHRNRDACTKDAKHGDAEVTAESDEEDFKDLQLLPTRTSWERLSGYTREIVEDGMAFLDSENGQDAEAGRDQGSDCRTPKKVLVCPAHKRATLDDAAATHIFRAKRSIRGARSGLSRMLAKRYGVTAKAVRDVWSLRTWTSVTEPFWNSAERQRADQKRKDKVLAPKAGSEAPIGSSVPTTKDRVT